MTKDSEERYSIKITGEVGRILGPDGRTYRKADADADLGRLANKLKGKRVTGFNDLYQLLHGLALCNELGGYTKRGRREGARQKTDPDAAAIEWGLAEAKRTGCRDPYALAGKTPTPVLKEIRRSRSRKSPDKEPEAWESTVKRIGGKLKIALSKLSFPD